VALSQRTPHSRTERKRLGAWYTPPALVEAIVTEVCRAFAPDSVLDPACGDGRFLDAFDDVKSRMGVDLDPAARWTHANALTMEWSGRQFDAVVGNPPFLNQLAALTTRGGRSPFGGGPYADTAAEFLALALRLTRRGGRIGLVLPQSLLSTRDAAAIRDEVSSCAALRWMWWSPTQMFDAGVRVWAGVWEVGGAPGPVRRAFGPNFQTVEPIAMPAQWTGLIAGTRAPAAGDRALGDIATFTSDFRDQYYGLVNAVADDADGPPLITSGLIDRDECLWGRRPVKFAKRMFTAPRVQLAALDTKMRAWAELRLQPKILIANQTKGIEAVLDRDGEWLPSVPVITCLSTRLDDVMSVLHSEAATDWVRYHAAGSGLSAGSVRLSGRLLASIPLPHAMAATPIAAS
jgi:hypothetical protein